MSHTGPQIDPKGGGDELANLVHQLEYAAYSWGFEAGKVGSHVDTVIAMNKAMLARDELLAALRTGAHA